MLCNQCQKEITWGKEARVNKGRLTTLENSNQSWKEEKWYCLPCYNKKQIKKVDNQKKFYFWGEVIITLTLIGLIIFLFLWKKK
jgi:hypothetical protein